MIDAGWQYGSLDADQAPSSPPEARADPDVAALLDEAESIVNDIGFQLLAEEDRKASASSSARSTRSASADPKPTNRRQCDRVGDSARRFAVSWRRSCGGQLVARRGGRGASRRRDSRLQHGGGGRAYRGTGRAPHGQ